jgi:gliding motility-associated-like protein
MCKKIILLLLICCFAFTGFAQKNKRKLATKNAKGEHFEILINDKSSPYEERYCPHDSIVFSFMLKDTSIADYKFRWLNSSTFDYYDTDTIQLAFPPNSHIQVYLYLEILAFKPPFDTIPVPVFDTIVASIKVDFHRTVLPDDEGLLVCQGRDITVISALGVPITITDLQKNEYTKWDTLQTTSGCDSLVRWFIKMDPYPEENYNISSCDSVIWGFVDDVDRIIIKRPDNFIGDFDTMVWRIFPSGSDICDTKIFLNVIIIEPNIDSLKIVFDQNDFCKGDDMGGAINLETNFTAFNWKRPDKDTTILKINKLDIELPGIYSVIAYMDTSLYDTLKDLRIVNCFRWRDTIVTDCPLIIPNVITPNEDKYNEVLGIKKLNIERENELTIYDRWGKSVFYQKNYQCVFKNGEFLNTEDAFKGISKGGRKLPNGTYYYAFKYKAFPKPKTYTGIIMIMR